MIRRLAAAAALLTLVLITAGGVVTNTDSGLACPDWPTCFGSAVPRMEGAVAVEHTHRLIATTVGLLTVALVVATLKRARQGWLAVELAAWSTLILGASFWAGYVKHTRDELPALGLGLVALGYAGVAAVIARARESAGKLAAAALGVVIFQGLLGGLTVLYRLPTLVLVLHLATSMLFASLTTAIYWRERGAAGTQVSASRGLVWLTTAAVYVQIVLGATVRHTGAGLVCVDLPYCRGALWPTDVHPMVHLHMTHRAFAFVVLGLLVALAVRLGRDTRGAARVLAWSAPVLAVVQITLGVLTITTLKDLIPVTSHLLVGALLLVDCVSLVALTRPAAEPASAPRPALGAAT